MECNNKDKGSKVTMMNKKRLADKTEKSNQKPVTLHPIVIENKTIAKTFWAKAWCENVDTFRDFKNRLARGRTYVRNKSVIDLKITKGEIKAQVMGASVYEVTIAVRPIKEENWKIFIEKCAGMIASLSDLLLGKFPAEVKEVIHEAGLFPTQDELTMQCSCPDTTGMCKHMAAALYGAAVCLDKKPALIFDLRDVNQSNLIFKQSSTVTVIQENDDHIQHDHQHTISAKKEMNDPKKKRVKPQGFVPAKTVKSKLEFGQSRPSKKKTEFVEPKASKTSGATRVKEGFEKPRKSREKTGFKESKQPRGKAEFSKRGASSRANEDFETARGTRGENGFTDSRQGRKKTEFAKPRGSSWGKIGFKEQREPREKTGFLQSRPSRKKTEFAEPKTSRSSLTSKASSLKADFEMPRESRGKTGFKGSSQPRKKVEFAKSAPSRNSRGKSDFKPPRKSRGKTSFGQSKSSKGKKKFV